MPWQLSMASDIGGRSEQQDCVEILSSDSGDSHLVVVADGMGGHRDGALAARTVIEIARRHFRAGRPSDPRAFLEELCLDSHREISALGAGEARSPGSTCVALYLEGPEAYWTHIGDSRLYHYRKDRLINRTEDHSVAQLMVSQGRLKESDAAVSALQNQLYMRLGGNERPSPEFGASEVEADDMFIVCSDGFWTSVEPQEALAKLHGAPVESDSAAPLVELARERGGATGDNISLVVMRWQAEQATATRGVLARWFEMLTPASSGGASIRRLRHRLQSLFCR
jgi:serine/threonine protein phosphatase PrpC